jgi:hypothetical protein
MKTKNAKTPAKRKNSRNGKLDKPLSIAKIREIYAGEWLAVHLTKVDRYNNPMAGMVVVRAETSDELYPQAKEYRSKNPAAKLYTFFAGNYISEGVIVVLNFCQQKEFARACHNIPAKI